MTDPGIFLPSEGPVQSMNRGRVLNRIASALGVPVSTFVGPADATAAPPTAAENEALLAAYQRIADPATRRRCLDMVRALAES